MLGNSTQQVRVIGTGYINNIEMRHTELIIEKTTHIITDAEGVTEDPLWTFVDGKGHFHAYSSGVHRDNWYPTLERKLRSFPCNQLCDGDDCDGYSVAFYECRICAEEVSPGTKPHQQRAIDQSSVWSAEVIWGYEPFPPTLGHAPALVSFRFSSVNRTVDYFGIATIIEMDFANSQSPKLLVHERGILGVRRLPRVADGFWPPERLGPVMP